MDSREIGRRMRSAHQLGGVVILAVIMIASARAAMAPAIHPAELKGEARNDVMNVLADDEAARRIQSHRDFPGDLWSQGDAFHGKESELVRDHAARQKVALESVLDVLDADLHERRVRERNAGAPACKPRPQYD